VILISIKTGNLFGGTNYETVLNYLNNLKPIKGYFHKELALMGNLKYNQTEEVFFFKKCCKIDAIRKEIKILRKKDLVTEYEHSLLLHDLIMAANDVANIAGTYGHYLSKFVKRGKIHFTLCIFVFRCW